MQRTFEDRKAYKGNLLPAPSSSVLDEMRRLYDVGHTGPEIAAILGRAKTNIYRWLQLYYPDRIPRSREFVSRTNSHNGRKGGLIRAKQLKRGPYKRRVLCASPNSDKSDKKTTLKDIQAYYLSLGGKKDLGLRLE